MVVGPEMTPLTIRDFTAGIYSNTNFQGALTLSAPLGSAQETNTYRCIGYPNGGLGPLPTYYAKYTIPTTTVTRTIVGLMTYGRIANSPLPTNALPDDIYIWTDEPGATSNHRTLKFYRLNVTTGTAVVTDLSGINVYRGGVVIGVLSTYVTNVSSFQANLNQSGMPGGVSPDRTRIAPGPTSFAALSFIWNWPYVTDTSTFAFPAGDRGTPASDNVEMFSPASTSAAGFCIAHEDRVLYQTATSDFDGSIGLINSYGASRVTDPPASTTLLNSQFYQVENATGGYGAWGSISTGELILVSKVQGGVQVSGDLLFASITKLPGMQATNEMVAKGIPCSRGFLYAVNKGGIYSWNGGNLSQKVSTQLRDNFYERTTPTYGVSFQATLWNDWVMYPNNFFLDTLSGGWWRIDNPSEFTWTSWDYSCSDSRFCIAAIDSYASGSENQIAAFDRTKLSSSWSWQSQPIPQSVGTKIQVQECEILATSLTGGTITVTLTGSDNTLSTVTFTLIALSQPQRLRMRLASQEWNVIVRITATDAGSAAAPILNEMTLFFTDGNPTSVS